MPGASYDTYDAVEQKFSILKFQPSTDLKEAAVGNTDEDIIIRVWLVNPPASREPNSRKLWMN